MFRCSRCLASSGSLCTQRSQLLFATDPHLPVQSGYLSMRQSLERNVRTLCEVSFWPHSHPHAENHGRCSDLPDNPRVKTTAAVSWDALNGHRARMIVSLLAVPFCTPDERAFCSDHLRLLQDPSQVACKSVGTQTCYLPATHDPWKATLLEQLRLIMGQKPVLTDLCRSLSEDLLTSESRLGSASKLTWINVLGAQSLRKKPPIQTGLFRKDFLSRWASSPSKPWTTIVLGQVRCLHRGDSGSVLSAENEARCRQVLQPNVSVYERERAKGKAKEGRRGWAAVLVSLCMVGGEPAFLFTLRSNALKGRHKGDVSFAGGKQDPLDRDVVDTALREAREELGVTVATSSVWGILKPLRDMSGMLIAPVLANLGPLEELSFRPNPSEVEEIFTISLAHVCSPKNRGYTNYRVGDRYGYTTPVFLNGKHRVWGLTAVALDHTLKIITPP